MGPYPSADPNQQCRQEGCHGASDRAGNRAADRGVTDAGAPLAAIFLGLAFLLFLEHRVIEKRIPLRFRERNFTGKFTICIRTVSEHTSSTSVGIIPLRHAGL
jgi:hypothetical protein